MKNTIKISIMSGLVTAGVLLCGLPHAMAESVPQNNETYYSVNVPSEISLSPDQDETTFTISGNTYQKRWLDIDITSKNNFNPRILTKIFLKKDRKNALNAAQNPGSFETQTQIPPEKGYDFSYHNLVCPLADFAKKYGYEEYMPYLCNLDYVMFGILGAPLYREHTCFDDDYCDFKLKLSAKPMDYDPPVFTQGNGYK
jgi:hypothetical protein